MLKSIKYHWLEFVDWFIYLTIIAVVAIPVTVITIAVVIKAIISLLRVRTVNEKN